MCTDGPTGFRGFLLAKLIIRLICYTAFLQQHYLLQVSKQLHLMLGHSIGMFAIETGLYTEDAIIWLFQLKLVGEHLYLEPCSDMMRQRGTPGLDFGKDYTVVFINDVFE